MCDFDIKNLRIELGISQEKLAEMVGVHHRTIQNWESGSKIPNSKHTILRNLLIKEHPFLSSNKISNGKLIPFYDEIPATKQRTEMDVPSQSAEYINTGDWFRDATAAIRHYGESMVEYPLGCILAIKEVYDRELIVPGRDYVIETSEYRVTKRIQHGKDGEHITAYSSNAKTYADGRLIHEPFDIPWRAIMRISSVLGYVVKKNGGTIVFSNQE